MSAKTNAARASHPSRIVRGLPSLLFPLCGERLEVRQRSSGGVPLLPELVADHDFHHRSASTAGPAAWSCSKTGWGGGRNAQTTSTRSHAVWNVPGRFTLENRRLATGSAAIVQQAQDLTFSLPTLCGRPELSAIGKARLLVQKLWTMRITCGKRWKK